MNEWLRSELCAWKSCTRVSSISLIVSPNKFRSSQSSSAGVNVIVRSWGVTAWTTEVCMALTMVGQDLAGVHWLGAACLTLFRCPHGGSTPLEIMILCFATLFHWCHSTSLLYCTCVQSQELLFYLALATRLLSTYHCHSLHWVAPVKHSFSFHMPGTADKRYSVVFVQTALFHDGLLFLT